MKNKKQRKEFIENMLKNSLEEFVYHFGDFKTADMWINSPWKLGEYKNIC